MVKKFIGFQAPLDACRNCPLQKQCMRNPVKKTGRQVEYFYDDATNQNVMDLARAIIDSPEGKEKYSRRMGIIEPVFGNLRGAKKLREFTLRGKEKVNGRWKLYCLISKSLVSMEALQDKVAYKTR